MRRLAFVTALMVAAVACGPIHMAAQMMMGLSGSYALQGTTTIPFTLSGNHIFITATIGGAPYAFIFDTAGAASLSPDVQRALKFPVVGHVTATGGGDARQTVEIVRVPLTKIGSAVYADGGFLVLPDSLPRASPIAGVRFGGILGSEIFLHAVTTIDYERSTLTFSEPAAFQADPAAAMLPVTFRYGRIPNVPAAIDGHAGTFDIDSGSSQGVIVAASFAESTGLSKERPKAIEVVVGRGIGGLSRGTAIRARTLTLGSLTLADPVVLVTANGIFGSGDFSGNVGGEVLRRFTVTLDAPNAKLYLRPNSRFGQRFEYNRAGLFAEHQPAGETAIGVVLHGPAADAGVKVGDVIEAIDGADVTHVAHDRLLDVWLRPAGTTLVVRLRRGGVPVTASLTLRDLL